MRSFLYVFQESGYGPVKVGHCRDVSARHKEMQVGNARQLDFKFAIQLRTKAEARRLESYLHKKLWRYAIRGEWFEPLAMAYVRMALLSLPEKYTKVRDLSLATIESDRDGVSERFDRNS